MSDTSLFLDTNIHFEKRAAAFPQKLKEEADEWPQEILSYAYNQLPFLEKFATDIELKQTEPARGYGIGVLMAFPMGFRKEAAHKEGRFVTFPIIVRDNQLAPIDVYEHSGRYHGVNEGKIKTALGTPDLILGVPPSSGVVTDISKQIRPPDSGTGDTFAGAGIAKTSSLRRVLPLATSQMVEKLASGMMASPGLKHVFLSTETFRPALQALAEREMQKEASANSSLSIINASVMTIQTRGAGYLVKFAHHNGYAPTEVKLSHPELSSLDILSAEELEKLAMTGNHVEVRAPLADPAMVKEAAHVDAYGVYDVQVAGNTRRGIVVPEVRRLDGTKLDHSLFTNGDSYTMHEKIAGVLVGQLELPDVEARGRGVFVYEEGEKTWATEELNVMGHSKQASGTPEILVRRGALGDNVRVSFIEGIQGPTKVATASYALPEGARWVQLGDHFSRTDDVDVSNYGRVKLASSNATTLRYNGVYWFEGSNRVLDGSEYDERADLYLPFGAMGIEKEAADKYIAHAKSNGSADINRTRRLVSTNDMKAGIVKQASVTAAPIKQVSLLNELAVLSGPSLQKQAAIKTETADEILALHLLTPENAAAYIDFLPNLEKAASNMAEILVASRLGMEDVRESAARNALEDMTQVIDGLEVLKSKLS